MNLLMICTVKMGNDIKIRENLMHLLEQGAESNLISDFSEIILNMIERGVLKKENVEKYLSMLRKEGGSITHSHKRSLLQTTKKRIDDAKVRKKYLKKAITSKYETKRLMEQKDSLIGHIEYFKGIKNLFWERSKGENETRINEILHDLSKFMAYLDEIDEFIEYHKRPNLGQEEYDRLDKFRLHLKKSIQVLNSLQNNLNDVLFLLEKKGDLNKDDKKYLENEKTVKYLIDIMDVVVQTSGFFSGIGPDNVVEVLRKETEKSIEKEELLIKSLESFWKEIKRYKSHKSSYNATRVVPETYHAKRKHVVGFYYQAGEKSGLRVTSGLLLKGLLNRNFNVRRIAIGESGSGLPSHALFIPKVDMGNVIKDLKKNEKSMNYKYLLPKLQSYFNTERISSQLVLLSPYFWTFFQTFCKDIPKELRTYLSFGPGSVTKEEVSWDYVKGLRDLVHFFTRSPLASDGLRRYGVSKDAITFTPNMFQESMIRKVVYTDREALKSKYLKGAYRPGLTVFSTIGRISGEKNLQSVFSAMNELLPKMKDAAFIIVGDVLGIESQGIKIILDELLKNPECKDRIIQIKGVDHESALEIVHMSDVTFAVSGREACNTLSIEALAVGTMPIVLQATTFPSLFSDLPTYVAVSKEEAIHSEFYFDERGKSEIYTDDDDELYRIHPSRAYWRIYIPDEADLRAKIMDSYSTTQDPKKMEYWRRKAIEYAWHTFASNVVLNRIAKQLDK